MTPEDWQTFQAQRNADSSQPPSAAVPPPAPPAGQTAAPPPKPKKGLGWPMAFLLLGLAMIGGCCYSFERLATAMVSPFMMKSVVSSGKAGVGVLVVENEIVGSVWATNIINNFKNDDKIKSVVVRVNSPGGAVAPCQEIYNSLKALGKPVVISMGSVAASGGLYIAAAGDHIMANPGTITGSIGVIMQSVEASEVMEKIGLKSQTIKSGQFKDMGSPFREMRPDERAVLETMVMDVYEQFLADLGKGRPAMDPALLRKLADGRIYTGAEAQKLGLVDELGGFEEALMKAAQMGGLPTDKRPDIRLEDGRKAWWDLVMENKMGININVPPALTPGFSLKYIYQPDLSLSQASGS